MSNYMNPFMNPMNPMGFGQFPQPVPAQPAQQQVVRVNGDNGARAYQMGANSSALLLDESGTMVWLVTSDGAGYKTVSAYDITPHQAEPPKDWTDLENRVKKLEEMMGGRRNGYTCNSSAAGKKPNESNGGAD